MLGGAQQGLLATQAFSFIMDMAAEFPKGCEVLEVWARLCATLMSCQRADVSLFSGVTTEAYGYLSIFFPS